jgi:integrase
MPIRTFLTPVEITGMIGSATNLRDKVILAFLSDTGCRVSELLAITYNDIDLERQEVMIPHLKRGVKKVCPKCTRVAGRSTRFCARCGADLSKVEPAGIEERSRLISIGEETARLLDEYQRGMATTHDKPAPDKHIINLTRQMVYKIVREAALSIGLAGKLFLNPETGKRHYVHPHDFRSALAVSWLDYAGSDANKQKALQTALGHKDFNTTIRYNKLTPTTVKSIGDEVRAKRFGSR